MIIIKTELVLLDEQNIKDKIYIIRGKKVMIDSDLTEIYGYTTKAFNQQVQRNIERFDVDFRFQLTDDEILYLSRSHFVTTIQTKGIKGGRVYNPYVFTEEGIYMLMTVLKGEYTILIVAHRLSTVIDCDRIFVVDNGIIIDVGIHQELMKKSEFYRNLYESEV